MAMKQQGLGLASFIAVGGLIGGMIDGHDQGDQHHSDFCKAIHT